MFSNQVYNNQHFLNKNPKNSKYTIFGTILFFTMISLPFELIYFKISLILLIFLYCLIHFQYFKISIFILTWFGSYILYGYFYLLLGAYYENEGVKSFFGIYLLWPLIYLMYVIFINKEELLNKFVRVLILSSLFISIYVLLFIFLDNTNLVDISNLPLIRRSYDLDFPDKIEIFSPFVTSLLFLIPFEIALFMNFNRQFFIKKKIFIYLLLSLNCLTAFWAARNALFLVILLAPIIAYFIEKIIDRKFISFSITKTFFIKTAFLLFLILLLVVFFSTQLISIIDNFYLGLDFTSPEAVSAYARFEQFFALLNAWNEYPIFGKGLGATIHGYYRNSENPWLFELSYLYQLYSTGLFGIIVYLFLIFFMIKKSIVIARVNNYYRTLVIATLTGTISFLIANATNPYLYAYDHMWAFFAPLVIINVYSNTKNTRT